MAYEAKLLNTDWLRRRAFFVIKRTKLLDPDWLAVAYPEQAKLQENLLPDSDSDEIAFFHI